MSGLILPNRFTSQPQYPAGIDWSNPLTLGLLGAISASSKDGTIVGAPAFEVSSAGVALKTNGSTLISKTVASPTSSATLLIVGNAVNSAFANAFLSSFGTNSGGTQTFVIQPPSSGASPLRALIRVANGGGVSTRESATYVGNSNSIIDDHVFAAVYYGTSSLDLYLDGKLDNGTTANTAASGNITALDNIALGGVKRGTNGYSTGIRQHLALGFNRALSASEIKSLSANPWQIFKSQSRRIWVASAGAPTIVPLGQVTETDSAQAISVNPQRRLLAQVVETDTAQAITPIGNKIVPLAQVTESDTAQAITANPKRRLVARAIETDTAQLITARKTDALLQVAETDTAQALTRVKRRALAQVVETDTAQAITPLGAKIVPLAQATETDTTQAITVNPKRRLVAQATETDQAQTITARKTRGLGQAAETGTTQSITVNPKRRLVAQVSETDTAQAISAPKRVLLGQATESNTAGAISLLGQTIAKPSSDVLAGAWLPSVGSTLYGAIDEVSADASDYIYTSSASTCSLGLSPAVDPLTSTGQVVRYQAWSPLGNGLTVRLKQGTTTIASWTHAVLPLTPTIWSQPLSAAECDAITDYTALRLDLESL